MAEKNIYKNYLYIALGALVVVVLVFSFTIYKLQANIKTTIAKELAIVEQDLRYDLTVAASDEIKQALNKSRLEVDAQLSGLSQAIPEFAIQKVIACKGSCKKNLGPTNDRFCFISYISGSFNSFADSVVISSQGDSWNLAVKSSGAPVAVHATCVRY